MCKEADITGSGLNDYLTNHGMRGSMISLLIEAGHTDSSIILRSGHTNTATLSRYHNLLGTEGLKQQKSLFQNPNDSSVSSPQHNLKQTETDCPKLKKFKSSAETSAHDSIPSKNNEISKLSNSPTSSLPAELSPSTTEGFSILQHVSTWGGGSINITVNINSKEK